MVAHGDSIEGAGEDVGLSVGIWAKDNGARSRLGLGRGGGHLGDGVMAWPRGLPWLQSPGTGPAPASP